MRKKIIGLVISDSSDKTRTVKVDTLRVHPVYGKRMKRAKKYYVHDELNESHLGDLVEIEETRPYSKNKRWKLVKINKVNLIDKVSK
jgi:small subunit ribosomal protein S17